MTGSTGSGQQDEQVPPTQTIDLRCPVCAANPGYRCRTLTTLRVTDFHTRRPNTPGYRGRNERGQQWCIRCERWKYPAIHSCPGVPQFTGPEPARHTTGQEGETT